MASLTRLDALNAMSPARDYVPITPGSSALAGGKCRAILCDTAGYLNLTNSEGVERESIPVVAGFNALEATVIDTPTSGSAPTTVVALY